MVWIVYNPQGEAVSSKTNRRDAVLHAIYDGKPPVDDSGSKMFWEGMKKHGWKCRYALSA